MAQAPSPIIATASISGVSGSAPSSIIRPGARWGQVDMLLDSNDGLDPPLLVRCHGHLLQLRLHELDREVPSVCQSMVTVCAAQAYHLSPPSPRRDHLHSVGSAWCRKN